MKKITPFLMILFAFLPCRAQFTASMHNTVQGNERVYTVYADQNQYRYEFEESGEKGIVIVKPEENKTFILMPSRKYVHITPCDGMMSRMNDPWQSYLWFRQYGKEKEEGNETVDGYKCLVRSVYQNDSKVFTCYFSEKLNFPVQIKSDIEDNTHMELNDVKSWKPDPSLFEVPKDYIEVDRRMRPIIPEPPAPESWTESKATLPYEATVERGSKVWLHVDKEQYYKFNLSNETDAPAKIIFHIYRNGEKLGWEEQGADRSRTYRLFRGESKTMTQDWKAGDDILIEAYEGQMHLAVRPE